MEALEKRVDDIDVRLRSLEQSNIGINTTLTHFNTTMDNFVTTMQTRGDRFEASISSLQKFAYMGVGALGVIQIMLTIGAK